MINARWFKMFFLGACASTSAQFSSAGDLISLECPVPDWQIKHWMGYEPRFIIEKPDTISEDRWQVLRGNAIRSEVEPKIEGIEIDLDFDNVKYFGVKGSGEEAEWRPSELIYRMFTLSGDERITYFISRENLGYTALLTRLLGNPLEDSIYWEGDCEIIEQPETIF